jgi:hypothetical protein
MNMLRAVLATAAIVGGALFGAVPSAQAQNLVPCAREGEFCRVPYPTRVIYGVPGRGTEIFIREGGVPCSNRVFGDPAPGISKRCAFVARGYGRGERDRNDGYRRPPRGYDRGGYDRGGYDRGFREYDEGYGRPSRDYDVY